MGKIASFSIALIVSMAAYGQMPGPQGPGGAFRGGPQGFGPERFGKVVTGAPYSADVNNSVTETLRDGNTIQRTTTGHVARDPQGRTYMTETVNGGPFGQTGPKTFTFISDPVAGYVYMLNPQTKVATRRPLRTHSGTNSQAATPRSGMRAGNSANVTETDLGTQPVNGVNAQGKRVVRTIPAGTIGNSAAITSTSEVWYSPDLQVVVSSTRSDPRTGVANYSLNNIQQGTAPDPSLFQVPSDYTIKDASGPGGRRGGNQPPPAGL